MSSTTVQDRHGNLVANPIFTDLNPDDENTTVRDANLVFLMAIAGVPWQDIARRDASGQPDLTGGLDANANPVGGFMTAGELSANGVWDLILGDPSNYVLPTDPLMIESVDPRTGANPITGDALQPPSAGELANPINGHEYSNPNRNDLQYTCIFPLATTRDCTDPTQISCDCSQPDNDNPLCDPNDKTTQKYAKAYPGVRHLSVVKQLSSQGVVASICPKQQTTPDAPDFGYRPAMAALTEALRSQLAPASTSSVSSACDKLIACCKAVESAADASLACGSIEEDAAGDCDSFKGELIPLYEDLMSTEGKPMPSECNY